MNSAILALFSFGSDMRRMMRASSAWHSTSVWPWNMVRTTGRQFPFAYLLQVNLCNQLASIVIIIIG
jgi:hypothetical protein